MFTIIKRLLKLFRFAKILIPGILITLFVAIFSYVGVFIEEEPFLMLQGGFDNTLLVLSLYFLSNILGWIISFLVFKFPELFNHKINYLFVPIFSIIWTILIQLIYYLLLFYYLTGLLLLEINVDFSSEIESRIISSVLIMLNSSVLIAVTFNLVAIFINRRKGSPQVNAVETNNNKTDNMPTSNFEDSITL